MRKLLVVLAALAIPLASHAGGFTLGLRLGYGLGMGDAEKDFAMSDYVSSQIPFQVDALYRVTPEIAVGGYFSYGVGQTGGTTKNFCDLPGADCSVSTLRFGAQGIYTFTQASPKFVPWAGLGIGWEATSLSAGGGSSQDVTGWEYLNLQAGANYKVSPLFGIGPYLQYSIGQYTTVESGSIANKAMHEWLSFGVQGRFDFGAK